MTKIITCAFCGGKGKDPYDLLSVSAYCLVCNGQGHVTITEPYKKCLFCSGTGKSPLGARVSCIVCLGKGYYHCDSDKVCGQCKGKGKSNDGLPCTKCGGKGFNKE